MVASQFMKRCWARGFDPRLPMVPTAVNAKAAPLSEGVSRNLFAG